jgi:hypothetical protein
MGLCREHLQELYTVHLSRFRTYKMALPPVRKGASEKYLPPNPFTGKF